MSTFRVRGPQEGDIGVYLKMENNSRPEFFVDKKADILEVIKLCQENSLEIKEILKSDFNRLYLCQI
ncbi:MAG: hypothetical protein LBU04_06195 [Christensenellaceae bacterium]|jgi:hypothetical protein|nr:hypothetical protein [Christensenellaceae bacterium]